jgi:putative transposase
MRGLLVPGYPHYVIRGGSRRMKTIFCEDDYQAYLTLLADTKAEAGVDI